MKSRTIAVTATLYVALVLGCLALAVATGCGASQRTKTIQASVLTVNAARDGWFAWDRAHEHQIVENAKTREEVELELAAYRNKSAVIYASFEIVYQGLKVAAKQTDEPSLSAALVTVVQLIESIKKLTGGP